MRVNSTACAEECSTIGGHMPYLFEADILFSQVFKNGTINMDVYPNFSENLSVARKFMSTDEFS